MRKLSDTIYYIPVKGEAELISKENFIALKGKISPQWESETNKLGNWDLGVYDWAFTNNSQGMQIHIPKLRTGGSIPENVTATKLRGDIIYGDCFLCPFEDKTTEVEELLK